MANPRKFSEKIALHNQKQAEETAAFEAIMREVSGATRPPVYQKQQLHIAQNLGAYRGGSLPNVNQMSSSHTIDLQNALHNLEDMKHGRQSLAADRLHRDRARQIHRGRPLQFEKRSDCSPYGSTYLSPPPDTSWRRTNSDSALHTSTMMYGDYLLASGSPLSHRRALEMENCLQADNLKAYWDSKKFPVQSRPKSCEVPNINIYPSQDLDSGLPHIPISNSTGSLPDLTTLHFPSPMVTPIDVEDTQPPSYARSMPLTPPHLGIAQQQASPGSRRRQQHAGPSPLILNDSNHMHLPLSPPVAPGKLALDARLRHQYTSYQRPVRQRVHNGHTSPPKLSPTHRLRQVPEQSIETLADDTELHDQLAKLSDAQITALQVAASSVSHEMVTNTTPPSRHSPQPLANQTPDPQHSPTSSKTEPSMTTYRNGTNDTNCQSPTSPLSQPSHSPSQSPSLTNNITNHSIFSDAFYVQQQQQALQHQFEQFSMLPDDQMLNSPTTVPNDFMFSGEQNHSNLMSDLIRMPLNTHMPLQLSSSLPNNKIPDIIFTGVDDPFNRQDLSKELGNAITGFTETFDSDFFPSDDALKVGLDPLDLDGLQMLTDATLIADPATEDSFRLDRL